MNKEIGPLDFLYVLKEQMRQWALGMHTSSSFPIGDWCDMLSEFARMIKPAPLEISTHRSSLVHIYPYRSTTDFSYKELPMGN